MNKIFETVKSALVEGLTSLDRPYAHDLHTLLYGETQHYSYTNSAEEAIAQLDVWACVGAVQTYEQTQFGGVYTPLSDACRVADMVVCIIGYELMQAIYGDTEYYGDRWDDQLSDEDLADMFDLAERWFEENPEGLRYLWETLDIA